MTTIAIVGLSDNKERDSYIVGKYLLEKGFKIIPVNPKLKEWHGIKACPNLLEIKEKIDIVDIFRKSEFVEEIVDDVIKIKAKLVWMQLGVVNEKAGKKAEKNGIAVVMDKCIMVEHKNGNALNY